MIYSIVIDIFYYDSKSTVKNFDKDCSCGLYRIQYIVGKRFAKPCPRIGECFIITWTLTRVNRFCYWKLIGMVVNYYDDKNVFRNIHYSKLPFGPALPSHKFKYLNIAL